MILIKQQKLIVLLLSNIIMPDQVKKKYCLYQRANKLMKEKEGLTP